MSALVLFAISEFKLVLNTSVVAVKLLLIATILDALVDISDSN